MRRLLWFVFLFLCAMAWFNSSPEAAMFWSFLATAWFAVIIGTEVIESRLDRMNQDLARMADELERIVAEAQGIEGDDR